MSLDRNPSSSLQDHFENLSLQTINSLPEELLLPIFNNLSVFERAILLQICKKWNQVILLHTPFWQYLRLSENFSPSSIVKILSIFNERSGCRLKHVIIETKISIVKHLNRIFVQLKRSGSSLNLLALRQERELNGKTRSIAMQHFPVLDSLIVRSQLGSFIKSVGYLFQQRVRFDIQNQSNIKPGLRLYSTQALLQLTQEDLKWFSKLVYLQETCTKDIMSMRRILEATRNLVALDLSGWTTMEEPSSSTFSTLSPKSNPVLIKSLEELVCPADCTLAVATTRMLEIDGDQTLLSGLADSLVLWKVVGLKAAFLHLAPYSRREDVVVSVEKARKFFQLNPKIQSLTLRCYPGSYGGDQYQINQILEHLDTPFQSQHTGTIDGVEGDSSSGAVDILLLPHLAKLTIENPIMLDGNLLRKIVKSRTDRSSQFRLEFTEGDSGEVVVIDDWEARGWMK